MPIQQRQSNTIFPQASSGFDNWRSGVKKGYIALAATFINSVASSASGGTKTTLTSAGAHGLTAAVAVGKTIYISGGTNWTAGFYNISSIDSDTTGVAVTIDVAYNAGFGSPTIALASTEVTVWTIQIPPLDIDSFLHIDFTGSAAASTNSKQFRVKFGGQTFFSTGPATATQVAIRPSSLIIQNRGVTNSQIGSFNSGVVGQNGATTVDTTTGTVDTSVATSLTLGAVVVTANEFAFYERYIVKVYR